MAQVAPASWAQAVPDVALMSADQLMALPDDGWRYELVAGCLVRMPPPNLQYDLIAVGLARALGAFVTRTGVGGVALPETGFVIGRDGEGQTVLVPALAFMGPERMAAAQAGQAATYVETAPDLVAEIAVPGQRRSELAEKMALWLAAGVRLAWVIWPERRQVDVWRSDVPAQPAHTLSAHEWLDGAEVVPGFTYLVAHLFL